MWIVLFQLSFCVALYYLADILNAMVSKGLIFSASHTCGIPFNNTNLWMSEPSHYDKYMCNYIKTIAPAIGI